VVLAQLHLLSRNNLRARNTMLLVVRTPIDTNRFGNSGQSVPSLPVKEVFEGADRGPLIRAQDLGMDCAVVGERDEANSIRRQGRSATRRVPPGWC
jgi:hypothetical protein